MFFLLFRFFFFCGVSSFDSICANECTLNSNVRTNSVEGGMVILTLCPFSPGSPGSPSKPRSPCRETQLLMSLDADTQHYPTPKSSWAAVWKPNHPNSDVTTSKVQLVMWTWDMTLYLGAWLSWHPAGPISSGTTLTIENRKTESEISGDLEQNCPWEPKLKHCFQFQSP